jgi:outer membrane protein TolC
MKRILQPWSLPLLPAILVIAGGCSTSQYRRSADKESYGAIAAKSPGVKNMDPNFTIEQTNSLSLEGVPTVTEVEDFLGTDGQREKAAYILSLEKSLEIGVSHSRLYQNQKEQLYLQALGLTLARHQFTPIFSGRGQATYAVSTEQAEQLIPDPSDPTKFIRVLSDNLVERNSVSARASLGADWLIRDIGRLSAAFTTDFFRFLSGNPGTVTSSQLGATLIRPLWRNAGFKQEIENLTQAERGLLYGLREFTLFRKRFSVDIATSYYQVLGSRDQVRNSYLNLQSSKKNAERTRALAREGRVTQADLGRLEQQELTAEGTWINAIRNYKQALDNFKIQLGLSIDTNIALDDKELEQLKINHPELSVDDSIKVAMAARLDYQNVHDQNEDALRRVDLAANGLKPQLDLVASTGINSQRETGTGFPLPDIARYHWDAGFNVDLPLERKAQRNSYRAALIAHEQSRRALEQREDEIKLQVRDSWRSLDQAKRSYEISEIGVKLAERRVEEQNLLAELGRAKAQDQVDAQNDLISSKNQLTQALVGHTIARLQFWNNMGILYIKDNGQWEEVNDAKSE